MHSEELDQISIDKSRQIAEARAKSELTVNRIRSEQEEAMQKLRQKLTEANEATVKKLNEENDAAIRQYESQIQSIEMKSKEVEESMSKTISSLKANLNNHEAKLRDVCA